MIFMVLYIPLIFPASWFLDKMVSSGLISALLLHPSTCWPAIKQGFFVALGQLPEQLHTEL